MKPNNQYSDPTPSYFENATTVDFMEEEDQIIPVWTPQETGVNEKHVYSNKKIEGYYSSRKISKKRPNRFKPGKAFLMATLGFFIGWRIATKRKRQG